MKKVLIATAALFFLAVTNVHAQVDQKTEKKEAMEAAQSANSQTKTPVKPDALPEAIKTTASSADFKGWVINSAFLVKTTTSEYYEVVFTKEKETKSVNFDKSGKPMV